MRATVFYATIVANAAILLILLASPFVLYDTNSKRDVFLRSHFRFGIGYENVDIFIYTFFFRSYSFFSLLLVIDRVEKRKMRFSISHGLYGYDKRIGGFHTKHMC